MLGENNFNGHVTDYKSIDHLTNNKSNLTNKTKNNALNIFSSNNINKSEAAIYFESSSSNYTDMEISMYNAIKLMHSETYIKKYEDANQSTIKMAGVWRELGNALEYSPEKTKQCMIMYRSLLYKFRRIKKKQTNTKLKCDKLNENGKTWKWYNLFEETLPKNKHQSGLMKKKNENELKYSKIQEELDEIRKMLKDLVDKLQKNKF